MNFELFKSLFTQEISSASEQTYWHIHPQLINYLSNTQNILSLEEISKARAWALDFVNKKLAENPPSSQWQYWMARFIYEGWWELNLTYLTEPLKSNMVKIKNKILGDLNIASISNANLALYWAYKAISCSQPYAQGVLFFREISPRDIANINYQGKYFEKIEGKKWKKVKAKDEERIIDAKLKAAAHLNPIIGYEWASYLMKCHSIVPCHTELVYLKKLSKLLVSAAEKGYNPNPFLIGRLCFYLVERCFKEKKNYNTEHYQKACVYYLNQAIASNQISQLERAYANMALGVAMTKEYKSEIKDKQLASAEKYLLDAIGGVPHLAEAHFYLAQLYIQEAKHSKKLKKKEYKEKAISHLLKALHIFDIDYSIVPAAERHFFLNLTRLLVATSDQVSAFRKKPKWFDYLNEEKQEIIKELKLTYSTPQPKINNLPALRSNVSRVPPQNKPHLQLPPPPQLPHYVAPMNSPEPSAPPRTQVYSPINNTTYNNQAPPSQPLLYSTNQKFKLNNIPSTSPEYSQPTQPLYLINDPFPPIPTLFKPSAPPLTQVYSSNNNNTFHHNPAPTYQPPTYYSARNSSNYFNNSNSGSSSQQNRVVLPQQPKPQNNRPLA